jgi:nucleotide-binding universal stress UspA family protein
MKLLVAVDFSDASEVAAKEVATRTWPAGTSIEVASALDLTYLLDSVLAQEIAKRTQMLVESVGKRLGATALVLDGDPRTVVVDRAKETGADLVVVGSHDPKGVQRFLLGSVAKAIVRLAPCSVLVARAVAPEGQPRKILLATDGSESSDLAARSVAARPWPTGSEIRLFSAVEIALSMFQSAIEPPFLNNETMELLREEAMKRAQNALASAGRILGDAGLKTSESISVLVESPKRTILDEAKEWGADLIVVGSHGRRGINRVLMGSVSEAVATHAHCSVEVIRKAA